MRSRRIALALGAVVLGSCTTELQRTDERPGELGAEEVYEQRETRELVALVNDAAELLDSRGRDAFPDFREPGSRWRDEEKYIFVLDLQGDMLLHPDPELEGKNQIDLKDINGKPIIRGLLDAATAHPDDPEGWYHYQWPVPDGLLPRWKSSYVRLVEGPEGERFVVGSGMYNDRMERSFVVELVKDAARLIEKNGEAAFPVFRDPRERFIAKDAYVFVFDPNGVELVNPAHPTLEGRNFLDHKDTQGKAFVRDFYDVVESRGEGWVSYMWPKPGESVSTEKTTYVMKVPAGDTWYLIGSGVYLEDAPAGPVAQEMSAQDLTALVDEAATLLESSGEAAFPELRQKGSKWFHDDLYTFVWSLDGMRRFHAADPMLEGKSAVDAKDANGRPYGQMILDAARSPAAEGWVHYMYPKPGDIFPVWKSVYVRKVTFPSGEERLVGAGAYNMELDKAFIEDVVERAALLVQEQGEGALSQLRDENGPFNFMDTYVFVDRPDGTEIVNPAFPSLEGKNLMNVRDAKGKLLAREYIDAAMTKGSGWVDYSWYRPGGNEPVRKQTFVRKVDSPDGTFIVGSGLYVD